MAVGRRGITSGECGGHRSILALPGFVQYA
jgi:hypothetical protein